MSPGIDAIAGRMKAKPHQRLPLASPARKMRPRTTAPAVTSAESHAASLDDQRRRVNSRIIGYRLVLLDLGDDAPVQGAVVDCASVAQ
jgi:hypothetical protein